MLSTGNIRRSRNIGFIDGRNRSIMLDQPIRLYLSKTSY